MGKREGSDVDMNSFAFIADLAGGELKGEDGLFSGTFLADSRLVKKGDVFVAFRGESADGHDYIADAARRGAVLAICENDSKVPSGMSSVKVSDTFNVLPEMAKRRLSSHPVPMEIAAVTGSVGKTTTREYLYQCLQKGFKAHSAEHSYNTLIGCSMAILSLPADSEILLLEMGASHRGEIGDIVAHFPPTVALVTEAAAAHLEGFGSAEGIVAAKMEIARSARLRKFFYNGDNPLLRKEAALLPTEVDRFSVGLGECDYRIVNPAFSIKEGEPSLSFSLSTPTGEVAVKSRSFGRHAAYPAAFALAVAMDLGVDGKDAAEALSRAESLGGRGRVRRLPCGAVLIDDSYNANPVSMKAVLEEAGRAEAPGRFAVVGEMLELGERGVDFHRDLVGLFAPFRRVWLVGKTWEQAAPPGSGADNVCHWGGSLKELADLVAQELSGGDLIVVKGSRGNALDIVADRLAGEKEP
ncbi:MAG: UDP-N-acetylmuramoyl-tripeptide--D-alanyl-D-alanine ligase [Aminivibrio sp.]|jgi:UDP-N-acetylmuramoyl-tripeptide--D-alanyl-D-alanine ligase